MFFVFVTGIVVCLPAEAVFENYAMAIASGLENLPSLVVWCCLCHDGDFWILRNCPEGMSKGEERRLT